MAKVGTEHADVIAAAITHPHHSLWRSLISNPQARCKCLKSVLDVTGHVVGPEPSHADSTRPAVVHNIGKPAVTLAIHRFGEINLPAQSIVESQLRSDAPGILAVEEPALLPLRCVIGAGNVGVVDVAGKRGHIAQKECG